MNTKIFNKFFLIFLLIVSFIIISNTLNSQNLSSKIDKEKQNFRNELQYQKGRDVILSEDFQNGIPSGWKTIDADGDGNTWNNYLAGDILGHGGEGDNCISSASYINNVGPLTPDNYLITPKMNLPEGATLKYWVSAQDAEYASEHYGVFVSYTEPTIDGFKDNLLFNETLTSKKLNSNRPKGTNVQGTWYQRILELPEGTKYVAFRHYDCTNNYWLNLDDVEISSDNGGEVICDPISNLTANVNGNVVKLEWSYNNKEQKIIYNRDGLTILKTKNRNIPKSSCKIVLEAHNVWGDGSGYQFLLDADHNTYGNVIPESGALFAGDADISPDFYSLHFEYLIPANAEPDVNTQNVIVNGEDEVVIPSGIYDWCITNAEPNTMMWIAGDEGPHPSRADDYEFEGGYEYRFLMSMYENEDGTSLITNSLVNFNIYRDDEFIGSTSELTYTDKDLSGGTYNYCVEVLCDENTTSDKVCLDVATGINNKNNLMIYPNPSNNIVNIYGVNVKEVKIFNNIGKLVDIINDNKIDVSLYSTGIYIFEISTQDGNIYNSKIFVM